MQNHILNFTCYLGEMRLWKKFKTVKLFKQNHNSNNNIPIKAQMELNFK